MPMPPCAHRLHGESCHGSAAMCASERTAVFSKLLSFLRSSVRISGPPPRQRDPEIALFLRWRVRISGSPWEGRSGLRRRRHRNPGLEEARIAPPVKQERRACHARIQRCARCVPPLPHADHIGSVGLELHRVTYMCDSGSGGHRSPLSTA